MMLLLDAGNSRIKWGVFHAGEWLASGALDNDALHREAPQQDTLRGLAMHAAGQTPIERIVGANVAGEAVASAIEHHVQGLATVEWLRPLTSCCGCTTCTTILRVWGWTAGLHSLAHAR